MCFFHWDNSSYLVTKGRVEEMRARWGDKEKTGPVKSALLQDKNGLKFYFTNPGHVVVPGLTGKCSLLRIYVFAF